MGRDKSLLTIDGEPMIARIAAQLRPLFAEVMIGANDPARYAFLELRVVPDDVPGQGPLMGIVSCLRAARYEWLFVTGCDVPDLDPAFVRYLLGLAVDTDIVMPRDADDRPEPLCALYRQTALPVAERLLESGCRRIVDLLPALRVVAPRLPGGWLKNLNTPDEFAAFAAGFPRGD